MATCNEEQDKGNFLLDMLEEMTSLGEFLNYILLSTGKTGAILDKYQR